MRKKYKDKIRKLEEAIDDLKKASGTIKIYKSGITTTVGIDRLINEILQHLGLRMKINFPTDLTVTLEKEETDNQ